MSSRAYKASGQRKERVFSPGHGAEDLGGFFSHTYLNIKQVELDGVSGINVLVRVEELAPQQQRFVLVHPLFSEGPTVIQPVH